MSNPTPCLSVCIRCDRFMKLTSIHRGDCRKPGNVLLSDIQRAARITGV